jgi:hypothetical protein
MTSDLNEVRNDTGRTAFCGPTVLAAITGYSVSRIEAEIIKGRGPETGGNVAALEGKAPQVKGTYSHEVADALAVFGYRMDLKSSFEHLPRKERPTVWGWMQLPRNAWSYYVLGVHKGREGHWILIKGVKLCDTYTGGKWTFVCDGPHRGARISEVYEVRRAPLAQA